MSLPSDKMSFSYRIATVMALVLIAGSPAGAQRDANLDVVVSVTATAAVRAPALDGFTVCVGTQSQRDSFGRRATGTAGTARLTGLPRGTAVITVHKPGYAGNQVAINLVGSAPNTATRIALTMVPGSGGPACPLAAVMALPPAPPPPLTLSGAPITDVPPTPAGQSNRLGEEILKFHGETGNMVKLDCKQFGTNFVMVGIQGRDGMALDAVQIVCAPLQSDGKLGTGLRSTAVHGGSGGTPFTPRRCATGEAVSGIRGRSSNYAGSQLRTLSIHCRSLNTFGLAGGYDRSLPRVGNAFNSLSWGLDPCTQDRPARGMTVAKLPYRGEGFVQTVVDVVSGVQLICEQPVRPTR